MKTNYKNKKAEWIEKWIIESEYTALIMGIIIIVSSNMNLEISSKISIGYAITLFVCKKYVKKNIRGKILEGGLIENRK